MIILSFYQFKNKLLYTQYLYNTNYYYYYHYHHHYYYYYYIIINKYGIFFKKSIVQYFKCILLLTDSHPSRRQTVSK